MQTPFIEKDCTFKGYTAGHEIYLDNCLAEERKGFPKAKTALSKASHADLKVTRFVYLKASFGRNIFSSNARQMLKLCDKEIAHRHSPQMQITIAIPTSIYSHLYRARNAVMEKLNPPYTNNWA